jgi:hypothetical protein
VLFDIYYLAFSTIVTIIIAVKYLKQQKKKNEKEAISNGILEKSKTKAEQTLTTYLQAIPEIKDHYKLNITIENTNTRETNHKPIESLCFQKVARKIIKHNFIVALMLIPRNRLTKMNIN